MYKSLNAFSHAYFNVVYIIIKKFRYIHMIWFGLEIQSQFFSFFWFLRFIFKFFNSNSQFISCLLYEFLDWAWLLLLSFIIITFITFISNVDFVILIERLPNDHHSPNCQIIFIFNLELSIYLLSNKYLADYGTTFSHKNS